jgi:heat shock protein HslJ
MSFHLVHFCCILGLVALTSCYTLDGYTPNTSNTNTPSLAITEMEWVLDNSEAKVRLVLFSPKYFIAKIGCKRGVGRYSLNGNFITFSKVEFTENRCPSDASHLAYPLFDALKQGNMVQISANKLHISNSSKPLASFTLNPDFEPIQLYT